MSYHHLPILDVTRSLGSSETGLPTTEIKKRLEQYGPNQLRRQRPLSLIQILVKQLKSSVVYLLGIALVTAFAFGEIVEGCAILGVLMINTAIGFFMELSGVRSMEALAKMGYVKARVMRDNRVVDIDAHHLVPGDIVLLDEGDRIAADMRVIEASRLTCDESALTGESLPVTKQTEPIPEKTPLAEHTSMLYKGCVVTGGSGKALVVATGMATDLGKISSLVEEADQEVTPLEKRLTKLGTHLIWLVLIIASVTALVGIVRGTSAFLMIEVGIALAVAAIPEGLPVVATIALSRGLMRMVRQHGLVKQLSAVETLGSTTLICTDKTGTLTENKMVATQLISADQVLERNPDGVWPKADVSSLLRVASLCSNASVDSNGIHGEPTETALLQACVEMEFDIDKARVTYPEISREPFDSAVKMMATCHKQADGGVLVTVKGAPEAVIARCVNPDPKWQKKNAALAAQGFRVLALAEKHTDGTDTAVFDQLNLLGLIALYDPPRKDVKDALDQCRKAGIRVVMITGDQAPTALYVANKLGLPTTEPVTSTDFVTRPEKVLLSNIVTRVSPKDKLDLISWHQKQGHIVAMTGDGVNDAPAVKKADIGIAMGIRGTEVAREAADVVLLDDAFHTIVMAIGEGRIIFNNIRDFVQYLLACNLAEVLVIFLAIISNLSLPILPLQILFLNLVTDVFPALALGLSEGAGDELKQAPRPPGEPLLTIETWKKIAFHALSITGATLLSVFLSGGQNVTVSFLTLGFCQLWHVFNLRHDKANHILANRYVWGALILCSALFAGATNFDLLHTTALTLNEWAIVFGCSLLPVLIDTISRLRWFRHRWEFVHPN